MTNEDIDDVAGDELGDLISFGEFVTLMWAIEADREKKEALFAGGSSNFADVASYARSINREPNYSTTYTAQVYPAHDVSLTNYGVMNEMKQPVKLLHPLAKENMNNTYQNDNSARNMLPYDDGKGAATPQAPFGLPAVRGSGDYTPTKESQGRGESHLEVDRGNTSLVVDNLHGGHSYQESPGIPASSSRLGKVPKEYASSLKKQARGPPSLGKQSQLSKAGGVTLTSLGNGAALRSALAKSRRQPITMTSLNSSIYHLGQHEAAGDPRGLAIEYGEMLPKEGVKSLPDYKVLAFLRVLTDYGKKLDAEQRYLESKQTKQKFK